MEDSFRVRVEKVFGSLASSSSSSSNHINDTPSSSSSLWSLSDQEIERKEWKRDPHHNQPYLFPNSKPPPPPPPPADDFSQRHLYSDLHQLHDDNHDHHAKHDKNNNHHQDEDWEIRASIGLDCTLDFEEEEDEYDKVAVGREKAGDILCMGDVVDYGIEVNAHNELPSSFEDAPRDPRANHMAAKLRLREDAKAAGTLKLSENAPNKELNDVVIPKPILKKREKPLDEKSPKRVRFYKQPLEAKDSDMRNCSTEETSSLEEACDFPGNGSLMLQARAADETSSLPPKSCSNEESAVLEDVSSLPQVSTCIPDYLRNPTRYTRYNLDSSNDMDEESNRKAYVEFLNQLKKPNPTDMQLDEASVHFQHPLTFTPKKKHQDSSLMKGNEFKQNQDEISKDRSFPVGIAAGNAHDSEVSAMEEDGFEIVVRKSSQRPGRLYRTRTRTDVDSDDHKPYKFQDAYMLPLTGLSFGHCRTVEACYGASRRVALPLCHPQTNISRFEQDCCV